MSVLAISATNVRRMLRDPANTFFVFVFPLLVILVIGAQFGSGHRAELGVVGPYRTGLGGDLVERLDEGPDLVIVEYDDIVALRDDVAAGAVTAGIGLPDGYDAALRSGRQVRIELFAPPDPEARAVEDTVRAAVAEQSALVDSARVATGDLDVTLPRARAVAAAVPGVAVEVQDVGTGVFAELDATSVFDLAAGQQLILFTFLTSLSGASALIQSRQLGLSRRMLSTPTSAVTILVGEGTGRFGIALVQAAYIVVGTWLLFGVGWGDPVGVAAIIVLFCLISAAAAMLVGAVLDNDAQAGGIGVLAGLGIAALGGCMVPLEVMSPTLRRVAHVTPHAWALDAFATLLRRGGSVLDVIPELAVLAAFALALTALGSWRLHRAIVAP